VSSAPKHESPIEGATKDFYFIYLFIYLFIDLET
jgi:hypothetical protein